MQLLDINLPEIAENLALDEALIESAEITQNRADCLRFWQPKQTAVIIGRSSKLQQEVNLEACRELNIAIYRRASGGAAIVTGPGCLMYSLLLSYRTYPQLRMIQQAHCYVLKNIAAGLSTAMSTKAQLNPDQSNSELQIEQQGTSDLVWQGRKFSGNSLRCKQDHFLYHGTIMYDFALEKIEQLLPMPPRQPDYRQQRTHADFVTNLPLSKETIQQSIINSFTADQISNDWPQDLTNKLAEQRYRNRHWTRKY